MQPFLRKSYFKIYWEATHQQLRLSVHYAWMLFTENLLVIRFNPSSTWIIRKRKYLSSSNSCECRKLTFGADRNVKYLFDKFHSSDCSNVDVKDAQDKNWFDSVGYFILVVQYFWHLFHFVRAPIPVKATFLFIFFFSTVVFFLALSLSLTHSFVHYYYVRGLFTFFAFSFLLNLNHYILVLAAPHSCPFVAMSCIDATRCCTSFSYTHFYIYVHTGLAYNVVWSLRCHRWEATLLYSVVILLYGPNFVV